MGNRSPAFAEAKLVASTSDKGQVRIGSRSPAF
jgi:hypothetical protein